MNATLVVCTLLVGGWMLPEFDDSTPPLNEGLLQGGQSGDLLQSGRNVQLPTPPSLLTPVGSLPTGSTYPRYGSRLGAAQSGAQAGTMPLAPTDPGARGSGFPQSPMIGQGQSPSGYGAARMGSGGYAAPGAGPSGAGLLTPPTATMPSAPTSMRGLSHYAPPAPAAPPNPMLNPAASKPFEQWQPSSPVSPWQMLYSQPTANGTIDPYTNYIRPAQSQQQTNQRLSAEINGVQGTMQGRGPANRGFEQEQQGTRGLANPQGFINYFGNTGGYFPGSGQDMPMGR
ncbi:MAG: hypothetical protein ABSF26_23340 [Thermoguttaceae bacterium]